MALKGETIIELTDVTTGEVEVHRDTNMVTNALQEIIKPVGYIKDGAYLMGFNGQSSPLNPFYWNALGGILLFNKPLPESKDTLFPPDGTSLVACGSRSMTNVSTTNKCRGNYNSSESVFTSSERKMKFVYDFPTDKGNGQISSVALTSYIGGLTGWGHPTTGNVTSANIEDISNCIKTGSGNNFYSLRRYTTNISDKVDRLFLLDSENDLSYDIRIESATEVIITRRRTNVNSFSIFLNSYTAHPVIDTTTLTLSTGFSSINAGFYMNYDNVTKSLYVLLSNNTIPSNSNFSILKIEIPSLSYIIITLRNSTDKSLDVSSVSFCGEYMYIFSSNYAVNGSNYMNMYKFDIVTNAVEVIYEKHQYMSLYFYAQIGDRMFYASNSWIRYNYTGTSYKDSSYYSIMYVLENDKLLRTELPACGISNYYGFQYPRLIPVLNNPLFFLQVNLGSGSSSEYVIKQYIIVSNYLATINNLATPVIKTADRTMKVTYTIQETDYV